MIIQDIGFDFTKIQSAIITKKNQFGVIISFIIMPTFIFLFVTFLLLYISKAPIDMNGIPYEFEDIEYQQFFQVLLTILGGISVLFSALIFVFFAKKSKPYLYLNSSPELEPIIYLKNRKKECYISDSLMITVYHSNSNVFSSNDASVIRIERKNLLFWENISTSKGCSVKHKKNKVILKYASTIGKRIERRIYSIKFDLSGLPVSYYETIYSSYYGNNNIKGFNKYFISDINRYVSFQMHPLIQSELLKQK